MVNITFDSSEDIVYDINGTTGVYNLGDIAWTLASTALVWIMIPGVGFFYSGLLRRKNALSMIYLSMMTVAVVSFQWFFWGYSLAFSDGASHFIGDLRYFGLKGVLEQPSIGSSRVPALVFCVFQLMFAAITPMLAIGAVAERSRLGPLLVFVFVWSTLVYDPIACWTWNSNGWSARLGGLDFAGDAVDMEPERLAYKPHNTTYVVIGTVFLWFGWFGFNGGSALSANLRATMACIVTNLAASVGGLTWMLWDWRLERKWSVVGFCSGAIAGLVAITPGSGFVGAPAAVLFGFMAGTVCNFATQLKFIFKYDDTLDIFASHAIGGVVGNVLTGLFAQASVAGADGVTVIPGGWLDHHWKQLGIQLADSVSGMSYSFVVTTIILWAMHYVPGLRLRCDEETEIIGVDDAEMGEFAYDYVGLDTEIPIRGEYNSTPTATGGSREPPHSQSLQESELEKVTPA
ncbi:ammonium transporter AmtB-like domain-containing protein [Pisolithus orientalis]|uniref:ammonium transporter AmtB-like domain-containing protein n=1 Tax=Pisolithus orientalis TaxID=936130 RepID=UPI002224296C|nr:ammonium transporter AmtB-like domain-containing protein [Pisolithus orientalis]KAI5994898.1 ammonium transporter AmtB-like domain-containing protein [Pisolithus orientalis]